MRSLASARLHGMAPAVVALTAGRLALALSLLTAFGATLARGQAPGTGLGNPPSTPERARSAEASEIQVGLPAFAPTPGDSGFAPTQNQGPAQPMGPFEILPPAPTEGADHENLQRPDADAFSPFGRGASGVMNPVVGQAPYRAVYRATWFPSEPVSGQNTNLGYVRQDLVVSFPLWQCAAADEWSASMNLRNETYSTHAILPDTAQRFPEDLWNINFGTTYRHMFENGWIGGATVSVGSASDKPFHSINEMTAGVDAFLRIPSGEHNAWLFSLAYSPTGQLPFPIPMVAFVWQPSEQFRANIGLPFMVMWRPTDDLTLDFSYMLLTTVHARASYRLCQPVRIYVAYASGSEAYLLADRVDNNTRFYNVDQRVTAGTQIIFGPHMSLDFSGGYVFDRNFFEGKSISSGTDFNRIDVGNGPYLSAQFQITW